jgi:hypothetical protein
VSESHKKAREAIIQRVKEMYQEPPKLAARNHAISQIPIEVRLRQSTAKLKDWLARVTHQIKVMYTLHNQILPGQLTLQEAFERAMTRSREANKYPP